jgi:tRNA(Arg) A34 adenosine deaminase TadA
MIYAQIHLTLPAWIHDQVDPLMRLTDPLQQVEFAIHLAKLNIQHATGGPFGAAIFDDQGRLISVGVNRVVTQSSSIAHAEIMAFVTAQQRVQRFRLNEDGNRYVLATSAQPCCQCYGASIWAGIDDMLIGARASDVEELTQFDEGPLPVDWRGELVKRGVKVQMDLARDAARAVLEAYSAGDGPSY